MQFPAPGKEKTGEELRRKAKDQEAPYVAEGVNIVSI
jgi:hypothetical protein